MIDAKHCIFCQILAGNAPATVLYEDDLAVIILDLFPIREGHTLIIPRHHAPLLEQQSDAVTAHIFTLGRRVIQAHKDAGLTVDAHNVVVNDGKAANQHVPHVHVHVIPRRAGDTFKMIMRWWTRLLPFGSVEKKRKKLEEVAEKLRPYLLRP